MSGLSPKAHIAFAASAVLLFTTFAFTQVNVTTYHNDISRTGQNQQETTLTPSLVSSGTFGRLFSVGVDGQIYGQPLILNNVVISGIAHTVVFVATENDSLYAFDANNGTSYWKRSFLGTGITPVSTSDIGGCSDITPVIGITSTPVIDPTTNTLYVVVKTKENGAFYQRLRAIDVTSGADKFGGPKVISATVPGTGVTFNPQWQNQRSALLLTNGHVVIAWGAHCDKNAWWGWLMSYNATTLAQEAIYNDDYNDTEGGGIWMGGSGASADASGNVYLAAGNGDYDGVTLMGDSVMKFPPPPTNGGWWAPTDWFTPTNQSCLEANDLDVGSGGVLILPDLPSGTSHYQRLIQSGKYGWVDVLDRNNMGKYCSTCAGLGCAGLDTNAVQELQSAISSNGVKGAPAYWNGNIYYGANGDNLRALSFNTTTGTVSTSATSHSANAFGTPGPGISISSNVNSTAVIWALDSSSSFLNAYDATNLGSQLYTSTANSCRDQPGAAVKFGVPTVANGQLYVGSSLQLNVYGQLTTTSMSPTTLNFGSHPNTDSPVKLSTTLKNTGGVYSI